MGRPKKVRLIPVRLTDDELDESPDAMSSILAAPLSQLRQELGDENFAKETGITGYELRPAATLALTPQQQASESKTMDAEVLVGAPGWQDFKDEIREELSQAIAELVSYADAREDDEDARQAKLKVSHLQFVLKRIEQKEIESKAPELLQ
jgi:hypothetical protein